MTPLLKPGTVIAVTGIESYLAIDRLAVDAAADGIELLHFGDCSHTAPEGMARVMRDAATELDMPVVVHPNPGRERAIIALADVHIFAPAHIGNMVWWRRPRDDMPFVSSCLPEFDVGECGGLTKHLLGGKARLTERHRARPSVESVH